MIPSRQKTVIIYIGLCYIAIVLKLFYIQIIKYPELSRQIQSQNLKATVIRPIQGNILDHRGKPLVTYRSLYEASLYKPDLKTKLELLLELLTSSSVKLSQTDIDKINKFIQNSRQKWISLETLFTQEQVQTINDPGIVFSRVNQPVYTESNLGNLFLSNRGLPEYYKRQLSGKSGFSWETKDAVGKTILTHPSWIIDPVNGSDISTYVNRQVQYLIESTLSEGIKQFSADSGEIVIMDPSSGGIIAMSAQNATPSAESTQSGTATPSASYLTNPIISHLFEPGSIVKPLVMALALDTKSISPEFICTGCNRPIQIGQYAISNWDNSFHADSSLKDIIKNSDNIGMSYIIRQTGEEKFLKYFHQLGMDRKTGIDLPGEARPVQKDYWPEIDLATASFGQGFALTQIQMITAFNAIANNGVLVSPHFNKNQKPQITKIYNPSTTSLMKEILEYGVDNGAVAKFKPKGMNVCGKSGTSQVAVKGGYSDSSTIASYIGFSPCDKPKFTMIVTIKNPRTSPWGSSTAAPIWYKIAENLPSLL